MTSNFGITGHKFDSWSGYGYITTLGKLFTPSDIIKVSAKAGCKQA